MAANEVDEVPEGDVDVLDVETPGGSEDGGLERPRLVGRLADVGELQPRRTVLGFALGGVPARVADPGCGSRREGALNGADRARDRSRAMVGLEGPRASAVKNILKEEE